MNRKYYDLTGQRFNKLVALEVIGSDKSKCKIWKCVCDCGNITNVSSKALRSGHTQSCGCLFKEVHITHGMSRKRLYRIWSGMICRCYRKEDISFKNYGGRGIGVCEEWKNNKSSFFEWALENGYNSNLCLDRIDGSKDYSPENCRWATYFQQNNNRKDNNIFVVNGVSHTIGEWSKITGISRNTLWHRKYIYGWSDYDTVMTPSLKQKKHRFRGICGVDRAC